MTPDYRPSLVRSFERHLRAENRSEHTIASYLESVRQAEAFLAGCGRTLLDARREDLEVFLGDLLQRRALETVATRYRRLRVLYRWLEEEEEIAASPMAQMPPPIVPEQPVPVVPEDGLRRLTPVLALRTTGALAYYVNGFVLGEQASRQADRGQPADQLAALAELLDSGASASLLVAIREGGSPLGEEAFEHGLRALIDGTAAALARQRSTDQV